MFLMASLENYKPENETILNAIDVFYMAYQKANFKGSPKSMFQSQKKKNDKGYFMQSVPDKETGEMVTYKVYY
jgi:hypothetical protein